MNNYLPSNPPPFPTQYGKGDDLEVARARACTEENLRPYFDDLQACLEKYNLEAARVYYVDEKGLHTSGKTTKVLKNLQFQK